MAQADERLRLAHDDADLLGQLAAEPRLRFLAESQLAAREFPAARHVPAARALRDQDPALGIGQGTRHDVDHRIRRHPGFTALAPGATQPPTRCNAP